MQGVAMNVTKIIAAPILAGLFLVGCASSYKANVYQGGQAQQAMRIKIATVMEIREVEISAQNTGTGATVGAAAGGVVGTYNGSTRGGILSGLAGAVIGGVVGNAAEKAVNAKKGIEITYKLDGTGEIMALVQEQDDADPIKVGDRIKIVEGSSTRVTKLPADSALR
jgi:outer membrane lipoprotein SlyB